MNGTAPDEAKIATQTIRVGELVKSALLGTLPRERAPHYWEPSILTPAHINMVMDRAAGFNLTEIAERWGYTTVQVANVLGHPDAQTIISTVLALQADSLTDIDQRFKAMSHEALNVKTSILRDEGVSPAVRDRVASDILDRAGYAPREKKDIDHTHRFLMPAQAATGLREALEVSQRIAVVDYSGFLQKPGAESAAEHLQVAPEVGRLEPVNGASPVPATELLDSQERVA